MQQASFKVQYHIPPSNPKISYNRTEAVLFVKETAAIFAIYSLEHKLISCKTFLNTEHLAGDIFLRLLFERESLLREDFYVFRIYSGHAGFALAPYSSVAERQLLHYARLVLNDSLFEEEFAYNRIPTLDAWGVFSTPFARKHIIQEYRPDAYLGHISESLIHFSKQLPEEDFVLAFIYDQSVLILAYKGNQLQLCNVFQFRANADLLYFLHSTRKATQLQGEEIPTLIMGDLDGKMSEIKNYFPHVQVPQLLTQSMNPEHVQKTPYWQFAFLNWGEHT